MNNQNFSFEHNSVYIDLFPFDKIILQINEFILQVVEYLYVRMTIKKSKPKSRKKTKSYQESSLTLFFYLSFIYLPKDREAAIGDLQENYKNSCNEYGKKRAYSLLIWDIFWSFVLRVKSIASNNKIKFILGILYVTIMFLIEYLRL